MGDLEFRGIDNSLTAKLRNAWKIRPQASTLPISSNMYPRHASC